MGFRSLVLLMHLLAQPNRSSPDLSAAAIFCTSCGQCLSPADGDTHECSPNPTLPCAQAEKAKRLAPGMLVAGRYRIDSLLGCGGMGQVYRAEDLKLEQPVALKFFAPRLQAQPAAVACFYREVRLSRQVAHPNVCRVFDIGEAEGRAFLIMEYVAGEDLACLQRRNGRLAPDRALDVARQLCLGLAAAHAAGVLHRDLKPANVMLDQQGQVRITDFGLGALASESNGLQINSGTPAYMAPEQLLGGTISVRTDIFSLGLLLHEIFTGRPAFEGNAGAQLLRRPQQYKAPSRHWSGLDPRIQNAVWHCLAADPAQRPESAMETFSALPPKPDQLPAPVCPPVRKSGRQWGANSRLMSSLLLAPLIGMAVTLAWLLPFSRGWAHARSNPTGAALPWFWCLGAQAFLALLAMAWMLHAGQSLSRFSPAEEPGPQNREA
jgi:eukaryotic-like serine/threonine-protein kinase